MNENNILDTIRAKYYEFRPAEQKVANYVLGNYEKIQFMSISELAEFAGVADATVTRFCRSLDLKGFNIFKIKLAACIGENNIFDPQSNESVLASGQQSAIESKTAIDETVALLDKDAIHQAIEMFECADRVMCAGSGGSMRMADECANLFSTVTGKFFTVADTHTQISTLATMGKDDIIFSSPTPVPPGRVSAFWSLQKVVVSAVSW